MLRISHQLIALSLLITSSLAISMDKAPIHQAIVIQEITAIEAPMRVAFLKNQDTVMIGNRDGVYAAHWKENKKTVDMMTGSFPMFCFPNQQRDAVASLSLQNNGAVVQLYDVNKQAITWNCTLKNAQLAGSCGFTQRCLYAIQGDGKCYNNLGETYDIPGAATDWKGIITADNIKDKIIFTQYVDESKSALCTINFDENPVTVTSDKVLENKPNDAPYAQRHSLMSKLIAICYPLTCIWNLYDQTKKIATDVPNCCLLAFHPNKPFLGILTKDGFVEIRDIVTQTIIAKTNESFGKSNPAQAGNERLIDFSEDGENLAVIVNKKCFVLSNLYPKNDQ